MKEGDHALWFLAGITVGWFLFGPIGPLEMPGAPRLLPNRLCPAYGLRAATAFKHGVTLEGLYN